MITLQRFGKAAFAAAMIATASACGTTGGLGDILGGVLGGGAQNGQVSGTVQSVDTRNYIVNIRQSNGQNVALSYDNQTQVVYQNRNYAITDLEAGDQVTATVQSVTNGYYVSRVDVNASATTNGTTANSQQLTGTVRQVDVNNGWFTVNTNSGTITVSMPFNPTRSDLTRFQSLRSGDYVNVNVTYLNSTRVELVRFN
jgi:hypothetical protein